MAELGDIVLYKVSEADAKATNKRRKDAKNLNAAGVTLASQELGPVIHIGNELHEGDIFPGIVVRKWSEIGYQLQVFLDGNDILWATSVGEGDKVREFQVKK